MSLFVRNEMILPIIILFIISLINKPIKIKMNAFYGIKYIFFSLISNFVNLIRKIEKNSPTITASPIPNKETRNAGKRNIKAPVLMKTGSKIIFLGVIGFVAAFASTKIIMDAIQNETIVL